MRKIDVVIVTYNSEKFLRRLLATLNQHPRVASITIVDNGSHDGSVALVQSLEWQVPFRLQETGENRGFGAAVNIGASTEGCTAPQLLIVNPDVAVDSTVLSALSDDLDRHADLAVVGAALVTTTDAPVSSARDFPTPLSIARRQVHEVEHGGALTEADWLCGALMLWRRAAFESVMGFSTEYFLYFEDVDICRKVRAAGWSVAIDGGLIAMHDQGHGQVTSPNLRRISRQSRRAYARKWHGAVGALSAATADATDMAADIYHKLRGS